MDPIAHTFVGGALAQTGLARRSAYGTTALVLGANLPDVDGLAMLLGSDRALWWRRGWTHGLPALVVLPIALTAVLCLWHRLRAHEGKPDPRPGALLALSTLAVVSHPALDWLNNYGMRWLMPFDGTWYYGDTLFIVDLWMWTLLGGVLFLHHSKRVTSLLGWLVFASIVSYLLLVSVPDLAIAKLSWLAMVVALVYRRVRRGPTEPALAARHAVTALGVLGLYIALMHGSQWYARERVTSEVSSSVGVERLMLGPVPVTPFERDVVIQSPDGYRYGRVTLFPEFSLELAPEVLPRLGDSEVVRAATASPSVRGFMNWARFPFAQVERRPGGYTVHLLDARYARRRRAGFGSTRVEVDDVAIRSESERGARASP